jgi:hypothetical protein
MTQKLEKLFNLADSIYEGQDATASEQVIQDNLQTIETLNTAIDKIDAALPGVRDLDTADVELDELSDMAKKTAEDLISLGMNVEARYSGTILQTAGVLFGHAITAKQAKIDKKLRMIDLQLKKLRLDQTKPIQTDEPMEGSATVIDRNTLLKQILAAKTEK